LSEAVDDHQEAVLPVAVGQIYLYDNPFFEEAVDVETYQATAIRSSPYILQREPPVEEPLERYRTEKLTAGCTRRDERA
jgi:hypothetical protein